MEIIKRIGRGCLFFVRKFIKWILISLCMGVICGFIGFAFYKTVHEATDIREANFWLLYLMPVGGLLIALIHKAAGWKGLGTNGIIDSIRDGNKVPILLVPIIFVSTAITHFVGASAGREGAALQIGGSIGNKIGRLLHLDDKDMKLITHCGMSAVFAALFGTPLTATIFAIEVVSVGVFQYSALMPCIISSMTAYGISVYFGAVPEAFAVTAEPIGTLMMVRVLILAAACAVVSILFCESMHHIAKRMSILFKNTLIKGIVGGLIILGLTLLLNTTAYNGAGDNIIRAAIEEGQTQPLAFVWKMLFTAISLGCGFKGGEVVPSFFVGACFGCFFGPILGIPAGFAAAIGLVALFCGSFNCPVASIILSVELFGAGGLIYFAAACGVSYMLSGYFGVYESQKIVYSKVKTEIVNRYVKK